MQHIRKLFGYIIVVDAVFGMYLMHLAAGTFGGFSVAVVAGLFYAFISREVRAWFGYQRLSVDGETTVGNQLARFLTYWSAWLKTSGRESCRASRSLRQQLLRSSGSRSKVAASATLAHTGPSSTVGTGWSAGSEGWLCSVASVQGSGY
jgi:hypothetical protein